MIALLWLIVKLTCYLEDRKSHIKHITLDEEVVYTTTWSPTFCHHRHELKLFLLPLWKQNKTKYKSQLKLCCVFFNDWKIYHPNLAMYTCEEIINTLFYDTRVSFVTNVILNLLEMHLRPTYVEQHALSAALPRSTLTRYLLLSHKINAKHASR